MWTSLILLFIKHVCRIPLRMSEEALFLGDDAVHGEAAYVFGPCDAHEELGRAGYIQGEMLPAATGPDDGGAELGIGGSTVEPKDNGAGKSPEPATPTQ